MLGLGLNKLGRAIRSVFDPANLFGLDDTGSYYDLDATTQPDTADAYQSTAAIYPVIDDGRGVVNLFVDSADNGSSSITKTGVTLKDADRTIVQDGSTGQHGIFRQFQVTSGVPFTASFFVSTSDGGDLFQIRSSNLTSWPARTTFSLASQEVTSTQEGSAAVELVGGRYRYSITGTPTITGTINCQVWMVSTGTTISFAGDSSTGITVDDAQVEQGSSATTYQYTGPYLNGPEQPVGLLLAGNRDNRGVVNRLLNSNSVPLCFSAGSGVWVTDITDGPDGYPVEASYPDTSEKYVYVTGVDGESNIRVSFEGKIRSGSGSTKWRIQMYSEIGGSPVNLGFFDFDSVGAMSDTGAYSDATIEDLGNDWYRFTVLVTASFTSTTRLDLENIYTNYYRKPQVSIGSGIQSYQETGVYLGGPGDHMGNATSANRMTYSLLPWGGRKNRINSNSERSSSWTLNNCTSAVASVTDPDGRPCDEITFTDTNSVFPHFGSDTNFVEGELHTISFLHHEDSTALFYRVRITTAAGSTSAFFNLTTLAVATKESAWSGGTVTDIGDGWYRFEIGYTPATSNGGDRTLSIAAVTTDNTTTADSGKTQIITRIQVQLGAYADYQIVRSKYDVEESGLPQIPYMYGDGSSDYHTLGKEYFGLKQDGRGVVNQLLHTQDFNNSAYTKFNVTVSSNAANAPDGTATADKLLETTANNYHRIRVSISEAVTDDFFIYAKAAERDTIILATADASPVARFDLTNGVVESGTGTITDAYEDFPSLGEASGWWKCKINASFTTSGPFILIFNGTDFYTGDASSGVYIWGAQLGAGDYQANSYTLGGSLGTAGLFCDPTQQWSVGGMFATTSDASAKTIIAKGSSSTNRTFHCYVSSSAVVFRVRGAVTTISGSWIDGSPNVILVTWDGSDLLAYINDAAPVTISVGTITEEAQNITWWARTDSSPGNFWEDYGLPLLMEARALTTSEATQFMQYHCDRIGVAA